MNDRKEKNNSQGVTLSRTTLIAAVAVILLLIAGGVAVGINWNHWFGEETPKTEEQKEAFQPDLDPDAENGREDPGQERRRSRRHQNPGLSVHHDPGRPAGSRSIPSEPGRQSVLLYLRTGFERYR